MTIDNTDDEPIVIELHPVGNASGTYELSTNPNVCVYVGEQFGKDEANIICQSPDLRFWLMNEGTEYGKSGPIKLWVTGVHTMSGGPVRSVSDIKEIYGHITGGEAETPDTGDTISIKPHLYYLLIVVSSKDSGSPLFLVT
ncbi:MAG: hypothetical protein PHY92_09815, partial [Alphaproteobacteria bacterium]|nr:hypothetical protein [Alphaproteobacteria bacterium]